MMGKMLRVIIADDEERICKLIQILADWDALGMEVVGVANNGPDALALARTLAPDILITDIRMPGMDGLELISSAKAVVATLEVIIISGYAQFDYAQTAIQYGVGDYLLKPINKLALNATLEKMAQRCHARKSSEQMIEVVREQSMDERRRRRVALVSDLIEGRAADASALGGDEGAPVQALILKMDYDAALFAEPSLEIVLGKVRDVFEPALGELCADYELASRKAAVYGVVRYAESVRAALRAKLRDCLNQLVEMRSLFGPVTFTLALGKAVPLAGDVGESFRDAQLMCCERLIEGTERLLEGPCRAGGGIPADVLARYTQEAAHAIDVQNVESADCAADSLGHVAMALSGVRGSDLVELAKGAGLVFATRLGAAGREAVLAEYDANLDRCSTAPSLFEALKALQRRELDKAAEQRRNQEGQPIRLAKQYIKQHFTEPLTLEMVSAAIGFSPNYFSTLFKRETGEGFAKYLTKVRMEEARSLLRETLMPVAEVCHSVGYEDIKHFTRTFKQEMGITPSEFRKLYG